MESLSLSWSSITVAGTSQRIIFIFDIHFKENSNLSGNFCSSSQQSHSAPKINCWFSVYLCTKPDSFVCRDQSGFPVSRRGCGRGRAGEALPGCLNRVCSNSALQPENHTELGLQGHPGALWRLRLGFRRGNIPECVVSQCLHSPLKAQGSKQALLKGCEENSSWEDVLGSEGSRWSSSLLLEMNPSVFPFFSWRGAELQLSKGTFHGVLFIPSLGNKL